MTVGYDGSENLANFSSYGNYKFQIRQTDPVLTGTFLGDDPVYVNVVGTPVLNQRVMHVTPNAPSFSYSFDALGMSPVEYVPTELLGSAPSSLNAASSQLVLLPTTGGAALHVPLSYQNFVTGSVPPSTSTNPTIPGVQVIDSRKPANQQSAPSSWLFDSGAAVTMVGRDLAGAIGINLATETPVATTTVMGIGGDLRTINGYQVQKLVVPLTGGDQLVFDNIVVFVPGVGDLPADLPGILGMNLINKSFSGVDELGNYQNLTNSAFNDWYVVPVNGAYWTGNGTWDSTTTAWSATSGGSYNRAWTAGADAIFEGAAGTVSGGQCRRQCGQFDHLHHRRLHAGRPRRHYVDRRRRQHHHRGGHGHYQLFARRQRGLDEERRRHAGADRRQHLCRRHHDPGRHFASRQRRHDGQHRRQRLQQRHVGLQPRRYGHFQPATSPAAAASPNRAPVPVILTGASSYSGVTTSRAAPCRSTAPSSTSNVLTNAGGANVTGGFLVLDYSANMANESSLASTVQSLLQTAYNGGTNSFQSGYGYQLYSTAATTSIGLGWVDNATTHQITIMPALYGDATLDGVVGPADLSKLLTNYGKSGMTWSQGDFTYDGIIGPADLSKLLTNYGKNGPLNINLPASARPRTARRSQLLAAYDITVSGVTACSGAVEHRPVADAPGLRGGSEDRAAVAETRPASVRGSVVARFRLLGVLAMSRTSRRRFAVAADRLDAAEFGPRAWPVDQAVLRRRPK